MSNAPNVQVRSASKLAPPDAALLRRLTKTLCQNAHPSWIAWSPCYHVPMIVSFKDQATEDIFNGVNSKASRKACPQTLWRITSRKLDQLDSDQQLKELQVPPGNRLEKLSGNRKTEYSIRINEQHRICFIWGESGPINTEVTDYH